MDIFYLRDDTEFPYNASVPWPHANNQDDWVDSMNTLEAWLIRYVGEHHVEWAYAMQHHLEYNTACIAFREERYKTLFLLTWA